MPTLRAAPYRLRALLAALFLATSTLAPLGCTDDSASDPSGDAGADALTADSGSDASADSDLAVDSPADPDPACPDDFRDATTHASFVPLGQCPGEVARLIVMGDSISVGVGAGPGLSYAELLDENDDSEWPDWADWDLESRFGSVEVVNVSVGGSTSTELNAQLDVLRGNLDDPVVGHTVAVITIGGNDLIISFLNPDLALRRLETTLRAIDAFFDDAARFPDGVSLYVMDVYEPSDGVGQVEGCFGNLDMSNLLPVLDHWRDTYMALGEELGFSVVDALPRFHGHGFYSDDPENPYYDATDPTLWFEPDCIHPNERGHHEIRRLFFEALARDVVAD